MAGLGERDHGGGLDAAAARFGGARAAWLDLSTGINPVPYPVPPIAADSWTALPDQAARARLVAAARRFWSVPSGCGLLAVPGASAAIAQIPRLAGPGKVWIPGPTYNEHAAAFAAAGWDVTRHPEAAQASVLVNPNNPDGRRWHAHDPIGGLRVIDESFGDVTPDASLLPCTAGPGTLVLKSFGKFWGLAGLRLGFVIGDRTLIRRLEDMLGPWAVSGPALAIGAGALEDLRWAADARDRCAAEAAWLDQRMHGAGATLVGGTSLFRLYDVVDAAAFQARLAQHRIWSRTFPYASRWLRLGLPGPAGRARLESALA